VEPAEIKLPACRYCIPLADETLGDEDLWSEETGQTNKPTGCGCLRRKAAAEPLSAWHEAVELCLQPPTLPHHSFCCTQYSSIFIGKSKPYKIRSLQPHLPFFLYLMNFMPLKLRMKCTELANFQCRSFVRKKKLLLIFLQKDK